MKYIYHVFFALFAASASFAATVDLSTLAGNYEAQNGDVLTGTLEGKDQPYKITIADGAKVTLSDATINGYSCVKDGSEDCYPWAGLTCLGNCTIELSGSNTVKGFFKDYPGIQTAKNEGDGEEYTLTIEGDGSLDASSNGWAAGIGGGNYVSDSEINCGNIIIRGGKITATGGEGAAGIGSGRNDSCGDITISGGKVTATGGIGAAGIGSGSGSFSVCGVITISGGEVTATGGGKAAGIGSGEGGICIKVIITIDVTKLVATKGEGSPYSVGAGNNGCVIESVYIGEVVAPKEESPFKLTVVNLSTLTGDYEAQNGDVLTGTLEGKDQPYKITIADGAKVTLSDATINGYSCVKDGSEDCYPWAGLTCLGNCTIELSGSNTVKGFFKDYPGIQTAKNEGDGEEYTLTIEGNGSLDVGSNGWAAGIGGGYSYTYTFFENITSGNITIKSGKITATGGVYSGAGIGCGAEEACGTITISGGEITATGGKNSAGIGGSDFGSGGAITISGGKVTAMGGPGGAGIGSGAHGTGGTSGRFSRAGSVTISGGEITAMGGDDAAGIGGGGTGTSGAIAISGGKVTATGGKYGAGIGGGAAEISGSIKISGGEVTATGSLQAPGIGSGSNEGRCGSIIISGGKVTATGGGYAAGIGAGPEGTSGDITITNDVIKVVATKGGDAPYSVGKGDGENSSVGTITIGGEVVDPIAKELFVFPYPTTFVDVETVGDKKYAIIDGNYSGEGALNIATDENVDKVIFERTFAVVESESNYSTIMFPFEIKANEVGNVKKAFSFLGIDVDDQNHKYVAVEEVTKFEAYKPYLIQLESEKTSVAINNTSPLVVKATPTALDAFDVAQSSDYNKYGDYVFRGVVDGKTWGASDPDVLGTSGAAAYGFAGTAATGIDVGQFVKVAEGAYIQPFRGYIYKKVPQAVKGTYALRQTSSIDDIPDVMNVVVVDRKKDGSEQTTVIGQFNSRTGEIRLNRTKRTYDLKGRHVRDASHMAKGVYFKK